MFGWIDYAIYLPASGCISTPEPIYFYGVKLVSIYKLKRFQKGCFRKVPLLFPLVCLPFDHSGLLLFDCGFWIKQWAPFVSLGKINLAD